MAVTEPETSTAGVTNASEDTSSSISMTYSFALYTVPDVDEPPSEAPSSIAIGIVMVLLLIAFIIFFVFLDLDSYYRSMRRGYRNMKQRCCKSKKAAGSDDDDNKEDDKKEIGHDVDEGNISHGIHPTPPLCHVKTESDFIKPNTVFIDETKLSDNLTKSDSNMFAVRPQSSIRRKPLVKQMSRKSLVYHIEDAD